MATSSESTKPTEAHILESQWEQNNYNEFRQTVTEHTLQNELNQIRKNIQNGLKTTLEEETEQTIPHEELEQIEQQLPEHEEAIHDIKQEYEQKYLQQAKEAKNNIHNNPQNKIKHNLDLLGTSLAISQKYRENSTEQNPLEPLEVRGWAVFSQIYDIEGLDAFNNWPKIWDTDKYFPAGRENEEEDRRNIINVFDKAYGDIWEKSQNTENHEGDKYTADINLIGKNAETTYECGTGFEADLIRPKTSEDSEYSFEEDKVERIEYTDELSFLVPTVDELIRHKGTISRDNGEGHDEFRKKDGTELINLLYVAQEKGIQPEEFEALYDEEDYQMIAERVQEVAPDINREIETAYAPEEEYIEEFIYRA